MTAIVLLGPPGAGKGTQATRISRRLGIPAISTGEIFRSNIAEGTELGRLAQSYMDRGEFVPDSVTDPMVRVRLQAPDTARGFLLDGYPRTLDQAHTLRDMLADLGVRLDLVLELEVDEDEVVSRLLNRAGEQNRADDTEPVIRHRLEVYHAQTEPMATYYADQDLLEVVSGQGAVDEVTHRIFDVLDSVDGASHPESGGK
jgi:adenylate kinase